MSVPDPFKPSQAGMDLGMGAELQQQVMSQILERRKKAMLAATAPALETWILTKSFELHKPVEKLTP